MARGAKFQSNSSGRLDRNLDFLSFCFVSAPGPYTVLPYHHPKLLSKATWKLGKYCPLQSLKLYNPQHSLLSLIRQAEKKHVDRFPLWPGISKVRDKQKGRNGNGLEQRRAKVLAGEPQRHAVLCPYQVWERFLQKGEQQAWLHHRYGNSQRAGWADLEMSPAWDYFQ